MQVDSRQEPGRAPMLRRLLECEGYSYERRLAPRVSEERNPDWQTENEACRNVDVRIAGHRGRSRAATTKMIAVNQVRRPCRPARGAHQRIQAVLAHHSVDTFRSRHSMVLRARRKVSLAGKRSLRFRLDEQLLAEVGHFLSAVAFVELNDFLQRMHERLRSETVQISVQIGLEFKQQHLELRIFELAVCGDVGRVDDDGARPLHHVYRFGHQLVYRGAEAEEFTGYPD